MQGWLPLALHSGPAPEVAREKLRKGADPKLRETTGKYLDAWLAGRRDLKASTVNLHKTHIRVYPSRARPHSA